jgi:hypothetical protein
MAALPDLARAGIGVTPVKQQISVKPGETSKFYLWVTNKARGQGDMSQSVRLEIMDFEVTEEGELIFRKVNGAGRSASKWIMLGKSELTLAPDTSEQVECTIKAPYTAVGEYYSAIMVTLGHKGKTDAGIGITFRIASGVFVTVLGQTFPRQAKIEQCGIAWPGPCPGASSERRLTWPRMTAMVKNTGKSRFDGSGTLEIIGPKSHLLFKRSLASCRPTVFGGDSRRFECPLDKPLPAGEYKVRINFDYQSQWAKAYKVFPMTISSDQASLLALLAEEAAHPTTALAPAPIKTTPDRLAVRLPAGGNRFLGLCVRNTAQESVRCSAQLVREGEAPIPDGWITLTGESFVLDQWQSANLPLDVRVPAGVSGVHRARLIVEAVGADGEKTQTEVPVELTVTEMR